MLTSCNRCQGCNNFARTVGNSRSATPNAGSTIKENLKLTGRFLLTLVTKAADIVGDNPAQVALRRSSRSQTFVVALHTTF